MTRHWIFSGFAIAILTLLAFATAIQSIDAASVIPRDEAKAGGPITHISLIEFKPSVEPVYETEAIQNLTNLIHECKRPIAQEPYIKSIRGGKEISTLDRNYGTTHVFVFEFESVELKDYWLETDPIRAEVYKALEELIERPPVVVEFENGYFF